MESYGAQTSATIKEGVELELDPFCKDGKIYWSVANTSGFPVPGVTWSLTTVGSGGPLVLNNGQSLNWVTNDGPATYTLTVTWFFGAGTASVSSNEVCSRIIPPPPNPPETVVEPVLIIPVTGAEVGMETVRTIQVALMNLGMLSLGISYALNGLEKKKK